MAAEGQTSSSPRLLSAASVSAGVLALLVLVQQVTSKYDLRPLAYVVVGLLIGLPGLLARVVTKLASQREEWRAHGRAAEEALVKWPPPPASEVDVFDFGVYPAIEGRPHPPYVKRDVDQALASTLEAGTFVLVHGPSRSGKSRTALEVLREKWPDALVLAPEHAEALGKLTAPGLEQQSKRARTVLWLDGLERFADGLRINALRALAGSDSRLLVLATIDDDRLRKLLEGGGESEHPIRRFVVRARLIEVPAELTPEESLEAVAEYPGRDFTHGFASAFPEAWTRPRAPGGPPTAPAHTTAAPSPSAPQPGGAGRDRPADRVRYRPRLVDMLAAGGLGLACLAVLAGTLWIHFTEGLTKPPSVAAQLADLHRKLSSCDIEEFSTNSAQSIEGGEPLVVATNPTVACSARHDTARPVLVYGLSHERLEPVYEFGPPPELLPGEYRFECRGVNRADPCWTDVTKEHTSVIVGGFRGSSATHAIFPVEVRDVDGEFQARPLLSERLSLAKAFAGGIYTKPYKLVGSTVEGYYVADFAFVDAPRQDRDVHGVRFVAGFTPVYPGASRRSLQTIARVVTMSRSSPSYPVLNGRHCVLVDPGDPGIVKVPIGRSFDVQLEKSWRRLEQAVPARAVCY